MLGVPNTIAHWQCDSYNAYNRNQEQGSKWSDDDTSIPSVAATWTPPRSPQYGVPIPTGTNPVCPSRRNLVVSETDAIRCIRTKTLQVRSVVKIDTNTKKVYFHDTLAELIVQGDTAHFHSPICKNFVNVLWQEKN